MRRIGLRRRGRLLSTRRLNTLLSATDLHQLTVAYLGADVESELVAGLDTGTQLDRVTVVASDRYAAEADVIALVDTRDLWATSAKYEGGGGDLHQALRL